MRWTPIRISAPRAAFRDALLWRLGLVSRGEKADARLAKAFMDFAIVSRAPLEQTLFDWRGGMASRGARETLRPPAAFC